MFNEPPYAEPHVRWCEREAKLAISSPPTLIVRHACSFTIGCKSRTDVDNCELLAEGKGVAVRRGLKEAEGKSKVITDRNRI